MGLLQNGFRDKIGVFQMYGAGFSNGAYPYLHQANRALTGRGRNLTAGEGITDDRVGLPMGYLVGGSYQLPQKPGQLSARMYDVSVFGTAAGTSGLPGTGTAALNFSDVSGIILPEDDDSPLRSASASIEITASATGELKMSGVGSASISVSVAAAELLGILDATGSSSISVTTGLPVLGAEASGTGEAEFSLSASASILPTNDSSPARTASATIALSGTLIPYAIGSMVGAALPYTDLSPQALAQAVWQAPATDNNQPGSMGSKVNTASSGGVDMDALAEAVWEYTP